MTGHSITGDQIWEGGQMHPLFPCHIVTFRPASSATMAEDTSQSEGTAHKGGDVRRPRFNALQATAENKKPSGRVAGQLGWLGPGSPG